MFEEVERTCDRVGIIREGRLATVDTIDTLRKRHMRTYTVTLDNPKLARAFAGILAAVPRETRPGSPPAESGIHLPALLWRETP